MKKLAFLFLLLLVLLDSCKTSGDSDFEVLEGDIISISSPENAISGDNVKIVVQFYGMNGCSKGFNIKADKVGQTVTLSAFYTQPVDSRVCTEILPAHKLTYTFFADFPGVYFFQSARDKTIGDTLTVY